MFQDWNNMAMKALVGKNGHTNTLDNWKQNARQTANMLRNSSEVKLDGIIYRRYPVVNSVR